MRALLSTLALVALGTTTAVAEPPPVTEPAVVVDLATLRDARQLELTDVQMDQVRAGGGNVLGGSINLDGEPWEPCSCSPPN